MEHRNSRRWLIAILLFAASARMGACWFWRSDLSRDRDAYLGIAKQLSEGEGFSLPDRAGPTAFRPPIYPILLAPIHGSPVLLAILHTVLGVLTVALTWCIAGRFLNLLGRVLAAGLVAFDPLLLRYAAQPMTETLFTFLAVWLVALLMTTERQRARGWFAIGILFGVAALTRPTLLAFGGLCGIAWGLASWRFGKWEFAAKSLPCLLGALLLLLPWTVRNLNHFNKPVFATTHGGYTLLLGNNDVFYREVVQQPWGTTWQGESLAEWQSLLEQQMSVEGIAITDETARDRWFYARAFTAIQASPGDFLNACVLRFVRFWNVVPLGEQRASWPTIVLIGIGVFYGAFLLSAIIGAVRLRSRWKELLPAILLVVAICGVHVFYWSNMRMRAPLTPVLALLAAAAWCRILRHQESES